MGYTPFQREIFVKVRPQKFVLLVNNRKTVMIPIWLQAIKATQAATRIFNLASATI